MSWIPNSRLTRLIAAIAVAGAAGAAMADTLVVRSSGPSAKSYPPGRSIAESARIVLQANDSLVLLDGRGTRTLKGPGAFSPSSPAAGGTESRSAIASLATRSGERRARIGAVRGAPAGPVRSPSIWFVDIGKSSNVCVADPTAVQLWRSAPGTVGSTTLTGPGGVKQTLQWAKGQTSTPWPQSLPISSGAEYRVSGAGLASPTTLKFAMLVPSPAGIEDMASALIRNGCDAQLELLIETVSVPGAATAS